MGPIRVAHLASHPVPYHVALYRELAGRPDVDLTVYYYSDASLRGYRDREFEREVRWDAPLVDGYRSRFFPSATETPIEGGVKTPPNWDLLGGVLRDRPDAVWAHGYAHFNPWLLAPVLAARGTPLLIREEQTLLHGRPRPTAALKAVVLPMLFALSFGLYIGEESRRYFRRYGMPDERLFPARYGVDNTFFRRRHDDLAGRRDELRRAFGIGDDHPVVLFCGRLVARKQPLRLIEAFAEVRRAQPCHLLVVGDGPLLEPARRLVTRLQVVDVHFAGFLNQSEIANAYTAADVFVLPSAFHETWGLVVNEAMNFGLPIVLSRKVGSAPDLVREGWNGYTFEPSDLAALARILARLVGDPDARRELGAHSLELVDEFSLERCADEVVAACTAATAARRPERSAMRAA